MSSTPDAPVQRVEPSDGDSDTLPNGSSYLAQEVKLTVTPPSGEVPTSYASVHVRVEQGSSATGPWSHYTSFESLDAIANAGSASNVILGVTGLPRSKYLRYRASFCRKSGNLKGCHCWSEPAYFDIEPDGTPDLSPANFSGTGPSDPAGLPAVAEDHFRRPPTNSKSNPGDGLSAAGTWIDSIGASGNQPKIAGVSSCASGQTGLAECADAPAGLFGLNEEMPSKNTYADVLLRPKPTFSSASTQKFNFALNGRYATGTGGGVTFAQVKFFRGFLGSCNVSDSTPISTLLVLSQVELDRLLSGGLGDAPCRDCASYWAQARPSPTEPMPDGFCWQGTTTPPLNSYFWIRSTIIDDINSAPTVSGDVAWSCANGQPIGSCAQINASRTFSALESFSDQKGRWYLEPHDTGFYVDLFRAGASPSGQ